MLLASMVILMMRRQLKAENMVKLPVIVYNRKSQEDVFISAVSLRRKLELEAVQEQKNGGKYIRPIVLFQAQPRNNDDSTTYEKIKHTLMEMGIPESEIAIKTADKDELKNIDLSSSDCNIRYIITVNALKEGWDCPFAYILATVANRTSSIDVEQILGRILRLPNTKKNKSEVLNLSYVITSSNAFYATLDKVVVGLNAAGFTSKDYRVDDCEDVVDERQTKQETNSQTELPLDNIQVGNDDKDTDELDGLNVELMKIQLETLESESAETGTEDSSVSSNAINDMLEHAKSQNELYWQEFQETEENYVPVPPEVGDISFLCNSNNLCNIFSASDITGIDTDLVSTIFHCCNSKSVIKMNICNKRNMDSLLNLLKCLCRSHIWNCRTNNVTSCFFKS